MKVLFLLALFLVILRINTSQASPYPSKLYYSGSFCITCCNASTGICERPYTYSEGKMIMYCMDGKGKKLKNTLQVLPVSECKNKIPCIEVTTGKGKTYQKSCVPNAPYPGKTAKCNTAPPPEDTAYWFHVHNTFGELKEQYFSCGAPYKKPTPPNPTPKRYLCFSQAEVDLSLLDVKQRGCFAMDYPVNKRIACTVKKTCPSKGDKITLGDKSFRFKCATKVLTRNLPVSVNPQGQYEITKDMSVQKAREKANCNKTFDY